MTLKPVKQTAHPSGVGDVISVEQLTGVVDFINDAGAAIEAEHELTADGRYVHRRLQFAEAAAHLRFAFGDTLETLVTWERMWDQGFTVPPRFVVEEGTHQVVEPEPVIHAVSREMAEVRVEWEMRDEHEQWVELGFGQTERSENLFDRWKVTQDGKRGKLFITRFRQWEEGGALVPPDHPLTRPNPLPDMGIATMCSLTLMIRTREK